MNKNITISKQSLYLSEGTIFCLGVFLKQFYILPSGSLQIGDIFMLLSFGLCLVKKRIHVLKIDAPILGLVVLSSCINIIYSLGSSDTSFLRYTIYLIFSLLVILTFRGLSSEERFLISLKNTLNLALLFQVIAYVTRIGRNYDAYRYMGTFNDPNQYGYYVLTAGIIIYMISVLANQKMPIWQIVVMGILIAVSASTGMLLGYMLFIMFSIILPILKNRRWGTVLFFLILVGLLILLAFYDSLINKSFNNAIFGRATNKLKSFQNGSFIISFMKDRSMLRILNDPKYLIYGSGEGNWSRWSMLREGNEVHGTMIALLFYYGIIPYMLFIKWIKNNIGGIKNIKIIGVYIALIIEAFTLINHRQPFFWMIFVLGYLFEQFNRNDNEVQNELQH